MITINTAEFRDGLYIRFNIPQNGKVVHEFATAKNISEAKKMMYFRNRNFIYQKIINWLRQREHALVPFSKAVDYAHKLTTIHELIIKLEYQEKTSFWNICSFIARHSTDLKYIAPAEKSSHYKNYSRSIIPIINFCIEMKGTEE